MEGDADDIDSRELCRRVCASSCAGIAQASGYTKADSIPIEILVDTMEAFLTNVGIQSKRLSELAQRTECSLSDTASALRNLGYRSTDSMRYFRSAQYETLCGVYNKVHDTTREWEKRMVEPPRTLPLDDDDDDENAAAEDAAGSGDADAAQIKNKDSVRKESDDEFEDADGEDHVKEVEERARVAREQDAAAAERARRRTRRLEAANRPQGLRKTYQKHTALTAKLFKDTNMPQSVHPPHVPSYLPPFPAGYTYMKTPTFDVSTEDPTSAHKKDVDDKRHASKNLMEFMSASGQVSSTQLTKAEGVPPYIQASSEHFHKKRQPVLGTKADGDTGGGERKAFHGFRKPVMKRRDMVAMAASATK